VELCTLLLHQIRNSLENLLLHLSPPTLHSPFHRMQFIRYLHHFSYSVILYSLSSHNILYMWGGCTALMRRKRKHNLKSRCSNHGSKFCNVWLLWNLVSLLPVILYQYFCLFLNAVHQIYTITVRLRIHKFWFWARIPIPRRCSYLVLKNVIQ